MRTAITLSLLLIVLGLAGQQIAAAEPSAECRAASDWAGKAFGWAPDDKTPVAVGLEVRRQDHGQFSLRKSVMDTPLKIGNTVYKHGLGTHSVSEIVVRLSQPAVRFEAQAGVDNNYDTAGKHGSVVFAVEVAGKEVFRSPVHRGGQEPLSVKVELGRAREFVLRVFDGGDGPSHDQCDWADAAVVLADGKRRWLDEMHVVDPGKGLSTVIPFSFVLDGKPSAELLSGWKRTHEAEPAAEGRRRHVITYADPATGLEIVCEATVFENYPAVEWLLRLTNRGTADTPILEKIRPLDLGLRLPGKGEAVLHHAHGSTCTETDFLPRDQAVEDGAEIRLAPNGGRPSDGTLPFFNLAWARGGLVGAIGWSGQWEMLLERRGSDLVLQAGQQTTRFKLHAGESVRTPRILLVLWQGEDRLRGHNLLRRLLLEQYVPRLDGQVITPPVSQNTWFVHSAGNDVTEANQLAAIGRMAGLGVEAYWLDAGWFEGGWPAGAGSWVPKAEAFPRGLKPLGDAAHEERGMEFILWFEPERVNANSRIAKEHPEFVLHAGGGDGLFNLGDPAARKWLTDYLSKCFADWGVDVYRSDFNIAPLPFWQAADAPDRQGIAEIRYVEGFYEFWDELRRRKPGLAIDTCASGGRRIDLETISRSMPLWRSDTQCCGQAMPVQDQGQTAGLSLYVPLHAGGCWNFDPYRFRSIATTGLAICPDTASKEFPAELAEAAIEEVKSLRPLLLGDYYPLLPIDVDEGHWCGWQFDRPELGQGFAVFFRRERSPYTSVEAGLRGLDAEAVYEVTFAETYRPGPLRKMTGAELANTRVEIGTAPGSVLVRYRKAEK